MDGNKPNCFAVGIGAHLRHRLPDKRKHGEAGFAIIVVLSGLLIVTALFAVASKRSIGHLNELSAEQSILENMNLDFALLEVVSKLDAAEITESQTNQIALTPDLTVYLQDVGGLIDLNTAHPNLLAALFDRLGFPYDATEKYVSWRREGRRLLRVCDIYRIVGTEDACTDQLKEIATVFSGRSGVSAREAPDAFWALMDGADGISATSRLVPDYYSSPALQVNFAVWLSGEDGRGNYIGDVNLGGPQGRILAVE